MNPARSRRDMSRLHRCSDCCGCLLRLLAHVGDHLLQLGVTAHGGLDVRGEDGFQRTTRAALLTATRRSASASSRGAAHLRLRSALARRSSLCLKLNLGCVTR